MEDSNPTVWDLASEAFLKISKMDEPFDEPVNDRLIELAEIHAGDAVVDVATGIGDPALAVARRVGPSGRVIATDQSTAMLTIAERRARERGLTNIEFRQVDANAYDFPDAAVDAVVCRWGLMFLSDLADALGRMRRSLKPGRVLTAVTWGEPAKVPIISIRRSVIRAFGLPASPNDPFRLSSAVTLEESAAAAGFEHVEVTRAFVPYEYASVDTFVEMQREAHESRMTALLVRTPAQQDEFWRALGVAAEPYAGSDGVVRVPSEILFTAARTRAS
jgi:ubiquinone/menaquinone biosynthesis C-methylase UbiE